MRTMTRSTVRPALCVLLLAGASTSTLAAPPKSLGLVSPDAPLTVVVHDMGSAIERLGTLSNDLNLPPQMTFVLGTVGGILDLPGVDASGSMAVAMDPFPQGNEQQIVMFLPVTDANAFLTEHGGVPGQGMTSIEFQGVELSAKTMDGFVALGETEDIIGAFSGENTLKDQAARLGPNGRRVVDGCDITLIAGVPAMAPIIRPQLNAMAEQAAVQAAMFQGAEAGDQVRGLFETLSGEALDDARVMVVGLNLDRGGIELDLAAQFQPGTDTAGFFDDAGDASDLMARVPNDPYYLAWAMDLSSPKLREIGNALMAMAPQEDAGATGFMDFDALWDNASGMAMSVGANPGLMMTGAMAKSTYFIRSDDPAALEGKLRETLVSMDGRTDQGIAYESTYTASEVEVEHASVSEYQLSMNMEGMQELDGNMGGVPFDPAMITQIMFGQGGGPRGFVATTADGVVQTYSRSSRFLNTAVDAANNANGLRRNEMLAKSASRLPEGCVMEAYLALDHVGQTLGPMAAMFMGGADLPEFNNMPPIAIGLAANHGGMHARIVVPQEVLDTVADLTPMLSGAMGGAMGGMLAP